mgnify:CR=1 FL=1
MKEKWVAFTEKHAEIWKFIKFTFTGASTSVLELAVFAFLQYVVFKSMNTTPVTDNAVLHFLGIQYKGYMYSYAISAVIGYAAAYVMNRTGFSLAEQLIGLQRGDVLIMMGQKSPHREGMTTLREAKRLGIPTILLTQAVDSRFSQEAQVVIDVPRGGDSSRMPLHGTVLVCLEMIVLSVASTTPQKTVKSLKRINDLHRAIGKSGGKRGS